MKNAAYLLIIFPVIWIGFRALANSHIESGIISETKFQVTYAETQAQSPLSFFEY